MSYAHKCELCARDSAAGRKACGEYHADLAHELWMHEKGYHDPIPHDDLGLLKVHAILVAIDSRQRDRRLAIARNAAAHNADMMGGGSPASSRSFRNDTDY
jgi:hypothetical protein